MDGTLDSPAPICGPIWQPAQDNERDDPDSKSMEAEKGNRGAENVIVESMSVEAESRTEISTRVAASASRSRPNDAFIGLK